jgi:glycosyltransferase involved in cell wall biosynthesis
VSDGTGAGLPNSARLSVFLLIRSLALGGAQRQLVQLARGLKERGHRVCVGIFYTGGPLIADLDRAGVPILHLNKGGRWDTFGFLLRLRRAIGATRPDVVYSFVGSANIFAAFGRPLASPAKLVWSIRASDMDLAHYDLGHRFAYALERRLSRTANLIISNSHAGREFAAANGFPATRVAVVPNGIDTNYFRPDPSLRAAQRMTWRISEREIVVGILARLDPMKGHGDFFQAAARIAKVRKDVRFLCIGHGVEEVRLKQMANDLAISDQVLFAGSTHDTVAALNGLDLFCSASVWGEGFSNAIAEAMACGVRCVVTDVGDSALIVGGCGTVVPPSSPLGLADAILEQMNTIDGGPFPELRARVIENFSVDAMIDRTLALFGNVVGRS